MAADYIYKNADDTMRFRIFKRESNEDGFKMSWWDVDVFDKSEGGYTETVSVEGADIFERKKDALGWVKRTYGDVKSLGNISKVTEGWEDDTPEVKPDYEAKVHQATTLDELKDIVVEELGVDIETDVTTSDDGNTVVATSRVVDSTEVALSDISDKIASADGTNPKKELERTKKRFNEALNDQALYRYAIAKKQTDNGTFSNLEKEGVDLDKLEHEVDALGLRGVFSRSAGIDTVYLEADEALKHAKKVALARVEADLKREGYDNVDDTPADDSKSVAKEPWRMTKGEFENHISRAKTPRTVFKTVDWGKQSRQGKRSGGTIVGGMGDISIQGEKQYEGIALDVPDIEEVKESLKRFSTSELARYQIARNAGFPHRFAGTYALRGYEGIIRKALKDGNPVPPEVIADHPGIKNETV